MEAAEPRRCPSAIQGLLETPIFTDTVVFRMAPWIMTPNTAAPLEVFVCRWVLGGWPHPA